jgi:hypothetical protein
MTKTHDAALRTPDTDTRTANACQLPDGTFNEPLTADEIADSLFKLDLQPFAAEV